MVGRPGIAVVTLSFYLGVGIHRRKPLYKWTMSAEKKFQLKFCQLAVLE